ncbi:MAG: TIGR03620 family F420-dependent LLM class oxidoreductase [Nocardioidaceae bacterium]
MVRGLGTTGAVIDTSADGDFVATAARLEGLGFGTIWLAGGGLASLDQVSSVLDGTTTATISTAIIAADRFDATAVLDLYERAEASHPGRLVLGLGGAHGPKPLTTLGTYLDDLDAVPTGSRVLAALGNRMLELARDRTAGALPVLVTPDYTASARALLGDATLAIQQMVVLESDPDRARNVAAAPLRFLRTIPGYPQNFRRMGFTDQDIEQLSDRLVDGLVAWGDADTIAARIAEYRQAGADHVAVMPVEDPGDRGWEALASALIS